MTAALQIQDLAVADLVVAAVGASESAEAVLREAGAETFRVASVEEVFDTVTARPIDVVLLPYDGQNVSADQLRQETSSPGHASTKSAPGFLALVSADASEDVRRRALEIGALDLVEWPGNREQLFATALLVAHNGRLAREIESLRNRPTSAQGAIAMPGTPGASSFPTELIGCSPALRRLQGVLSRACDSEVPVLIEGAEGTGKTLCARVLHHRGRRAAFQLVELDGKDLSVSSIDEALEAAQRGTLIIDNVEQLPTEAQARLVRFLKERSAASGNATRLVATTAARLAELTARGAFREDLYYRLNVFPISLPTLQERREDVSLLAGEFLRQSSEINGLPDEGFSPAAMILLESHPWQGNVAQLRNAVFRAHPLAGGNKIDRVHLLSPAIGVAPSQGMGIPPEDQIERSQRSRASADDDDDLTEDDIRPFQEEEQRLLSRALRATRGNVRRAAQLLGIGRATLYRKIQVYNLRMH